MNPIASNPVVVPIEWVLTSIGVLGATISTLASVLWHSLNARIKHQEKTIRHLEEEVGRLSKGCLLPNCLWKDR